MAYTRTQRRENELPYIPFGPFQIRLPFIHYKIESVEFIQGLILGVTALAAVPYLEQYLGLPYELAWSCVIIETFLQKKSYILVIRRECLTEVNRRKLSSGIPGRSFVFFSSSR